MCHLCNHLTLSTRRGTIELDNQNQLIQLELDEIGEWVNDQLLEQDDEFAPIERGTFLSRLADGTILPRLLAFLFPESCKTFLMAVDFDPSNRFQMLANHNLSLEMCACLGLKTTNIGAEDIMSESHPTLVLSLFWQVVRRAMLKLVGKQEDDDGVVEALLEWVSEKSGSRVTNFHSDMSDCRVLVDVMCKVAPHTLSREQGDDVMATSQPLERAQQTLQLAELIHARRFLSASDIVNGAEEKMVSFWAHLYSAYAVNESQTNASELHARLIEKDKDAAHLKQALAEAQRERHDKEGQLLQLSGRMERQQAEVERLRRNHQSLAHSEAFLRQANDEMKRRMEAQQESIMDLKEQLKGLKQAREQDRIRTLNMSDSELRRQILLERAEHDKLKRHISQLKASKLRVDKENMMLKRKGKQVLQDMQEMKTQVAVERRDMAMLYLKMRQRIDAVTSDLGDATEELGVRGAISRRSFWQEERDGDDGDNAARQKREGEADVVELKHLRGCIASLCSRAATMLTALHAHLDEHPVAHRHEASGERAENSERLRKIQGMLAESVKEGWLMKRGRLSGFARRFVVLKPSILFVFKSEEAAHSPLPNPLSMFSVDLVRLHHQDSPQHSSMPYFRLQVSNARDRKASMEWGFNTEDERLDWIVAIKHSKKNNMLAKAGIYRDE